MPDAKEAMVFLESEIRKTKKRAVLSFEEYLDLMRQEPERVLRNIFQLFYDMVKSYVGEGVDNPFFADRLFANRFIRQVESLKQGFQQNRVYAYDGPSGCGKSTFLNNTLRTFESYTRTKEGQIFEILWEIDVQTFNPGNEPEIFSVPCPSHDHPILVIPKHYRSDFLDKLLPESDAKSAIFSRKEYEWIFRGEACTICKSIFSASLERLSSVDEVFGMIKTRTYRFDRRLGDGISIFNPGDRPAWGMAPGGTTQESSTNRTLQEKLEKVFGANTVKYVFSPMAKTNNGIYVLMDIKGHNEDRLLELHNVISEGVHKVGDIEEQINSLFFALMNPEDKRIITDKKMESFAGRIKYNKLPFVLEPATEANIYRNVFGDAVDEAFLPRIMKNFARAIIASRMHIDCKPLKEWIPNMGSYKRFCDENGLLLRMEIYGGIIPDWLSEDDRKKFTAPVRRALIAEGPN